MQQKTGRNDPCPCGSGKKYKKCCLPADQARESEKLRTSAEEMNKPAPALSLLAKTRLDQPTSGARRDRPVPPEQQRQTKVAALSTEQIVERLGQHDIQITKEAFLELCRTKDRAWAIGEEVWLAETPDDLDRESREFVCLAACELWRRWSPDAPTRKQIGDLLEEGSRSRNASDPASACESWLALWKRIVPQLTPLMRTTSAADRLLEDYELMFNWVQDLCEQLRNAALDDEEYAAKGIRFCEQIIAQFSDEKREYLDYFRCDMADMLVLVGQRDRAEAILNEIIEARPDEAVGYVTLAGALTLRSNDAADRKRAAALLERALARPVVDPEDWDLEARLADLRREPSETRC